MKKELIFGGFIGLIVGGGIGSLVTYSLTKKKYISILEETKDNYEKLLAEADAFVEDDIPDEFKRYIPEDKSDELPKISSEEKEIIKEKLKYNNAKTIAYSNMYGSPKDILEAQDEVEGEVIDEPETIEEVEEENNKEATNIFEAAQKASGRKPVIISEEHFNDYVDNSSVWEVEDLFLYNDGTITNAEDKVIDGEELDVMLGDCLDKYGFRDSNEKMIYIQCFKLNTVYSIQKFEKPFIP
ncbi:MAG: hypothetical protein J6S67_07805 [Methanobrevibacter sp.]|nr:hypothetical protein [Methanobrevibacter sp.]